MILLEAHICIMSWISNRRLFDFVEEFASDLLVISDETLAEFQNRFGNQSLENIDPSALRTFLNDYFTEPGTELEPCQLDEWQQYPPRLMRIQDPKLRAWALKLNDIWKDLCRKVSLYNVNFCVTNQSAVVVSPNYFLFYLYTL